VTEVGKTAAWFPIVIAFSPDGAKIAVGYYEAGKVDLLDARSLRRVDRIDLESFGSNTMALDWAPDGRLFAGGLSRDSGRVIVLEGGHEPREVRVAEDDIRVLDYVAPHGLMFVTFEPAIGILSDAGEIVRLHGSVTMAMSDDIQDRVIAVSADAQRVMFPLALAQRDVVLFDLARLSLDAPSGQPAGLIGLDPAGVPPNLDHLDFPATEGPSSATGLGSGGFLLGTNFNLRRFDAAGTNVWTKAAPGKVGAVIASADKEVAVAIYADGTVRWHRVADGEELLVLFVHAPDKRWIAWTPRGYYAASPGGEELIGWHVNRGWDASADFFPAGQFRERFYRPDILQLVLQTRDLESAIAIANERANRRREEENISDSLPPIVEILDLRDGAVVTGDTLTVPYKLRSPSGRDVIAVEALIDGRPLSARGLARLKDDRPEADSCPGERGLARLSTCADGMVTVDIPHHDFELSLIARTADVVSVPARVKLKWQGEGGEPAKPRLFAVLVGVSQYGDQRLSLSYAAQDAKDLERALKLQADALYGPVETKLLVDADATVPNILDALAWLEDNVTEADVGVLFLAGHGVTDERQRFYYLPHEADPERLRATAVSDASIQETIGALSGKVLFLVDACHSADAFRGAGAGGAADVTSVVNEFSAAQNGVVMFASSTGREVSFERPEWENGAFTEALLEGLAGKADFTGDGSLTVAEVDLWLSERVKSLTDLQQHAVVRRPDTVPDFAIAAVR
jgi:hypothetical protein